MSDGDPLIVDSRGRRETGSGETSPWLISLAAHLAFLLVFSLLTTQISRTVPVLILTSVPLDEVEIERLVPDKFNFDPVLRETIGSSAMGGLDNDLAGPTIVPESVVVPSLELEAQDFGQIEARELVEAATGPQSILNHSVKGHAGVGVVGPEGAIDRITHEILLSIEERNTLVVWFFDRSGSLQTQRKEVLSRFNRVYDELGVIQSSQSESFSRQKDKPLLTSVVAFGAGVSFLVDKPTDDVKHIKNSVEAIVQDTSGIERVFRAFYEAAKRYKKYRTKHDRNLIFVAFTDEAGDDQDGLDRTVNLCRRLAIPVYVVGVPAPFGRKETRIKWIDPDPRFDQSPQWGRVDQGPESLLPERIQIGLSGFREDESPIDSGFGPFALTRLCYETGGIYFAAHPNRNLKRRVSRRETDTYSSFFSAFFDPQIMRRYRPEYVSALQYRKNMQSSRLRASLVHAAQVSSLRPLESPRRRFVVRSEAQLANSLTEAQKDAARLEPTLNQLTEILRAGEQDRKKEIVPRWQAGYDLALGRVLANKVRVEGYNAMLAQAKQGLKFRDEKNNTWRLDRSNEINVGSRLQRDAGRAKELLERVARDHESTPWALLATRELKQPMGWTWKEGYTAIDPPGTPAQRNNRTGATPRDDQARKLRPPRRRRDPPKL